MRSLLWLHAPLLLLVLPSTRGAFGPKDHANAAQRSLGRARELLDQCLARDAAQLRAGRSPLEAESDPRPVFKHYLMALRHVMLLAAQNQSLGRSGAGSFLSSLSAMFVARGDLEAFLARAGELDVELSELASCGNQEPYFFWHGPKRHVPQKMDDLLSFGIDGQEVRGLLTTPPEAPAAASTMRGLGLSYPLEARKVDLTSGSAVRIMAGDACTAGRAAADAGLARIIVGGKVQLDPCLKGTVIWDVSAVWTDYFGASRMPLQDMLKAGLSSLGRRSIDFLGLPPKAWLDERLRRYCHASTSQMQQQEEIGRLGLAGAASLEELNVIFSSEFVPAVWIVQHDDCAPVEPKALELASKAGVEVIAFGDPCGSPLFDAAAEKESLSAPALLSRWTAELGMHVALSPDSARGDLRQHLQQAARAPAISQDSWRLLSGGYALVRPMPAAAAADCEDVLGLRATLQRAAGLAKEELGGAGRPRVPRQAVRDEVWQELEQDKKRFYDNNWFIYRKDLLSPEAHEAVRKEAARLWRSQDIEPNCNLDGADRSGGYIIDASPTQESSMYQLIYGSEDFRQWVSRINGHMMFPSDFPMEIREYPAGSKGMACHRDLLMYTNETLDLEFVYTIDNFGTCVSTFQDRKGVTHEVHSEPNSLMMLRPNAALHCVKPSEGGHRTILKWIYVGDYKKSPDFGMYAENSCGADNPNVKFVVARREGHGHSGLEL